MHLEDDRFWFIDRFPGLSFELEHGRYLARTNEPFDPTSSLLLHPSLCLNKIETISLKKSISISSTHINTILKLTDLGHLPSQAPVHSNPEIPSTSSHKYSALGFPLSNAIKSLLKMLIPVHGASAEHCSAATRLPFRVP